MLDKSYFNGRKPSQHEVIAGSLARAMERENDRQIHKRKMRGLRLKEWREINGISKAGLARAMDVHWNTITRWEDGFYIPREKLIALVEMGFNRQEAMLTADGQ